MQILNEKIYIKTFEDYGIENYKIIIENCIVIFNQEIDGYIRQCMLDIYPDELRIDVLEESFYRYKKKSKKIRFRKNKSFNGVTALDDFCKYWIDLCNLKDKKLNI